MTSNVPLSGLETTFGIDILKSVGTQESYVFSPISLLFALALLGKEDFNSTVADKYSEYGFHDPDVYKYLKNDLGDILVRGDSGVNDVRRNLGNETRILFNQAWESKLPLKRTGVFYSSDKKLKQIIYLKNEKKVLLGIDDVFQMISIRYNHRNLNFVVLLPRQTFGLQKALKKLTKSRLETLLHDATVELVHVMIPKLDILQMVINSKQLGLQAPIKTSLKYKNSPCVVSDMLYRPDNREPYFFKADHPFIFAVLRKGRPVYFGVYS
ncbi:unnamed protein product [Caenorhabditis nigoni]